MITHPKELLVLFAITGLFCLFIFFYPLLTAQKESAIAQSVEKNMVFFHEMVKKYIEKNGHPPQSIKELAEDADKRHYHKTLFNPVNKVTAGNIQEKQVNQVIIQYKKYELTRLSPDHKNLLYEGKVGYYADQTSYVIYGHLRNGLLLTKAGNPLILKN